MYVCLSLGMHLCAEERRACLIPWSWGVTQHVGWVLNSGPKEEQGVLLTSELSLQLVRNAFK